MDTAFLDWNGAVEDVQNASGTSVWHNNAYIQGVINVSGSRSLSDGGCGDCGDGDDCAQDPGCMDADPSCSIGCSGCDH